VILPLGDAPNPRGIPLINYALLAANVAVYVLIALPLSMAAPDPNDPLLREYIRVIGEALPRSVSMQEFLSQISAYDLFIFEYGFRPAAPHLVNLFTSIFLHANFVHLFGNMLFLWIYGDNVEHRLGSVRYLFAYLGTGVAATLFYTLFGFGSPLPMVGASGAISGVLGLYFVWFPRNQVRLFMLVFPFVMDVVTVPARLVLGLYLIVDNLLPFLFTRGVGGGVAHGAHIGGFLAGLALAWVMDRREVVARPRDFGKAPVGRPSESAAAAAVHDALANNRFEQGAELYFSLPAHETRRLLTPQESLAFAEWLRRAGHPHAALAVYRRHIRDYPRGPGLAEAHLGAGLVQLEDFGRPTPAYQHFLAALDSDPLPETVTRARAALQQIAARQKLALRHSRRDA
jgi:membrane associated rhomboid family serine protease